MACLVVLVIICGLVWVVEFAQLMAMRDEDFPGRYDKALWVAAFVFGNIFGVFAFFLWKRDRAFENREDSLLHMARSAARETARVPAAPVPAAAPSSTAIQRPSNGGA